MTRLFTILLFTSFLRAEEPISYNREIRPILSENCFYCHGQDPNTREADIALHLAEFAYKEHEGTTPIVPGDTENSEVVFRIFDDADPMPPEDSNRSLTEQQKQLIKKWIEQGAKYEDHWSFTSPTKSPVPAGKNPVDHFIQKRLDDVALKPSPQADPATLARRATLALTGLQPSPAQLADLKSHGSYEKFVDSLLDSDAYAERMTLFWLDAARYADTDGYQNDGERSNWPWRDWVIDAFRKNMPFDQFTIEQIAGDMLPNPANSQLLATAFNRNHRQNAEGGALAPEFYVENVIDRVETTSAVWLGLTTGCARCHDHKYDPISQREFYQLFSYFNNIGESGTGPGPEANPVMKFTSPLARVDEGLHAELKAAEERLAHGSAIQRKSHQGKPRKTSRQHLPVSRQREQNHLQTPPPQRLPQPHRPPYRRSSAPLPQRGEQALAGRERKLRPHRCENLGKRQTRESRLHHRDLFPTQLPRRQRHRFQSHIGLGD
jgi:hypothetical protein